MKESELKAAEERADLMLSVFLKNPVYPKTQMHRDYEAMKALVVEVRRQKEKRIEAKARDHINYDPEFPEASIEWARAVIEKEDAE